ncbi:MAG TPA: endonuclease/exonuclease/phosphatase family protein [Rudaea sp.]|nr:endonuclease/exonuclease/phosphatase family protein [Rudaea sp.]
MVEIRIASYNTHGGVGIDRRFVPRRIARVLGEIGADVVALQELESSATGFDMLEYLRNETGFHAIAGPTLVHARGDFGNGLLTRFPVLASASVDLNVAGREPRGAIDARLDCSGTTLRVIATHLGLNRRERSDQIARLLTRARAEPDLPTVLLGDLNEWFLSRRTLGALHDYLGESPARATFPSPLPVFALDRLWMRPASALRNVHAHRSRRARVASDHLPLVADIALHRTEAHRDEAAS